MILITVGNYFPLIHLISLVHAQHLCVTFKSPMLFDNFFFFLFFSFFSQGSYLAHTQGKKHQQNLWVMVHFVKIQCNAFQILWSNFPGISLGLKKATLSRVDKSTYCAMLKVPFFKSGALEWPQTCESTFGNSQWLSNYSWQGTATH